jgi:predicted secreted hydrolase
MKKRMRYIAIVLVISVAGVSAYFWWQAREAAASPPEATLITLLIDDETDSFARATEPGVIEFPRDFGPHNSYRTEWWYYTGNLESSSGRLFGFQLTFFRRSLTPPGGNASCAGVDCPPRSEWRTNQVYLAHFTVSDLANGNFHEAERFSRGSAGLAGAQSKPYRIWLENWSAQEVGSGSVRLYALSDGVELDLLLRETVPPILHGEKGLSQKGPEPGNASYYYSIVQQQVNGQITIDSQVYDVTGLAWKDHEYGTSALSEEAVGWDWFSIQLDGGQALMFFQIRRSDGQVTPFSSGTFLWADGSTAALDYTEWTLEVQSRWTSPNSGVEYPAGWRIAIPSLELELTGKPMAADQELNVSTTYWEGAVAFEGTLAGRVINGKGYVELTGYDEATAGRR